MTQPAPTPVEVEVPPATLNHCTVIAHKPSETWGGQFVVLCCDRRQPEDYVYIIWIAGKQKDYRGPDGEWVCHFGDYHHGTLAAALASYTERT